ncbi:pilin [Salinisphaera sp. T31B1]|uniref:pilin n=1 Tax=Salinisphaera sp. T31B1 TaxID=727963 RepID=UPI00333FF75C
MQKQQGFTLIELMIVVAIIGILAAIAIPQYQNYVARSQMTEALTLADGLKTDVVTAYSETGACPDNSSAADGQIGPKGQYTGNYVTGVVVGGTAPACTIEATLGNQASASIASKTLTLKMSDNSSGGSGGSASWTCESTADPQYLPSSCTGSGTGT